MINAVLIGANISVFKDTVNPSLALVEHLLGVAHTFTINPVNIPSPFNTGNSNYRKISLLHR